MNEGLNLEYWPFNEKTSLRFYAGQGKKKCPLLQRLTLVGGYR
jgi:hypothetical protein